MMIVERSRRRLTAILTAGAILWIVVLALLPVHRTAAQLALLGAGIGAWIGLVALAWERRALRFGLIGLPGLLVIPFLLPAGAIDRDELRASYVDRVREFEGTKYAWGGENGFGIDCSGLPRRALRDALFAYGIRHADGGALRRAAVQWWHDASAKALSEGHRAYTVSLDVGGTVADLDPAGLAPGDLAVTADRRHMLVYVGDGRWSQADPHVGRVITLDGRLDANTWFDTPVTTHRWSVLADE